LRPPSRNGLKELGVRPGDTIGVMDQFDRTSVGKIDKKALRQKHDAAA